MFSKRTAIIVGVILVIAVNIIVLSIAAKSPHRFYGLKVPALYIITPFQDMVSRIIVFMKGIWNNYFFLVSVSKENTDLRHALGETLEKNRHLAEIELSNARLRGLLKLQETTNFKLLAAEVIGKGHSPWYRSIIIDKGTANGVEKGLPIIIPDGIVGQVVEATRRYSRILLITDQNSAVDAVVQRTRARGIIEGEPGGGFIFKYVLRKEDIKAGDAVVSSGLDGVYPKGLSIGWVSGVIKPISGIFQEVSVLPLVDFNTIEEVLVILNPPKGKS
jgi:rod shape-determining protein MreC